MVGGTLWRYLFRRQLAMLGWLLLGIVALVAMIDLTETVSRYGDAEGFGLGAALLLVALHLPPILEQVLPFAVLLASMIVLVSLNRRYELVVARSVGASAWQFLAPIAAASFLVGIVSLVTLNPLAAAALQWEEQVQAGLIDGAPPDDDQMIWLQQADGESRKIISALGGSADGLGLRGVTVYNVAENGAMVDRIDARLARLADGEWVLSGATRTRPGQVPEMLGTHSFPTPILPEAVAQRATPPEATSFLSLFGRIEDLRRLGFATDPFAMQLHSLLTRPVLFVGMTLIAGTVCLRFARFGQARTIVIGGLAAAFVLYVATVLVRALGSTGLVPPLAAAWVPVVVAMFVGVAVLLRTEDG